MAQPGANLGRFALPEVRLKMSAPLGGKPLNRRGCSIVSRSIQ
jgi:hypothetical protein